MDTSNLPEWAGAESVYSRCYRFLELMAHNGHVTSGYRMGKCNVTSSQDMDDMIEALANGDEERLKGLVMLYRDRFSYLSTEMEP